MVRRALGWRLLWGLVVVFLVCVASADARVYWTGQSAIGRANLDGSGANASFITTLEFAWGVAVDGAHIYWANNNDNTIGRAKLDGTSPNQRFITGGSDPRGVALDDTHIYWANNDDNTIGRANLDGTGVDHSFITGPAASDPAAVAVDGAHIYWANQRLDTIGRANLDGSGVKQDFITGASFPRGVAVDAGHVYWSNEVTDTIGRANLDGTSPNQRFITGADGPEAVAVDGARIYWTDDDSTIGRANLNGSGVNQSFITAARGALGLAVTPLETTITAGPFGTVGSSSASFSFVASEPAGFECGLDGSPFLPCASPRALAGLSSGSHLFYVRAKDTAGNVDPTPAFRPWRVTDVAAPGLSGYRLSPRTFRAAGRGASVQAARARIGTRVSYVLTEAARVRFTVERATQGRRVRGRCRQPTRSNRRARRCRRYAKLRGSFTHEGRQLTNRFMFSGRLRGRKLRPGRYRLVAAAADPAGNKGKPTRANFRIVTR